MSIPTPFNPLGTLGGLSSYIKDGLILWFDALLESPGTKDSLTNFASGTKCHFSKPLTVENGIITRNGADAAKFNPIPMQPIDGNQPYGENYSADLCATVENGSLGGLPWAENVFGGGVSPCFQLQANIDGYETVLRLNDVLDSPSTSAIGYVFGDRKSLSLHMEFSRLFIDGAEITKTYKPGGALGNCSFSISSNVSTHCYRLYNRKLSVEEQRHNYAIDKARFGLIDV